MEPITIVDAAKQVGVSDRTLRRAIEEGKLIAQPRLHPNKPILITPSDLDKYIASRQPVQPAPTQEAATQEHEQRIAALEREVESLHLRIQELEDLQQRVQALESLSSRQSVQSSGLAPAKVETRQETSRRVQTRRAKQQEPTVALADFNQRWQGEYTSTATHGDVKALVVLKPSLGNGPGDYHISYCDWEPTKNRRGVPPDDMKDRGKTLKETLLTAVHNALVQHGWIVVDAHHTYRLPNA